MNQMMRTLSLLALVLTSTAVLAEPCHEPTRYQPYDEWDHGASEGQRCGGYDGNQCAQGLACEQSYNNGGVCMRMCRSDYDCSAGFSCQNNGYVGVCRDTGYNRGNWDNGRYDSGRYDAGRDGGRGGWRR